MAELTQEEMKMLQDVFRNAAETLPRRVFTGARLEWRQGKMGTYVQMIRAAKSAAMQELDKYEKFSNLSQQLQATHGGGRPRANAVSGRPLIGNSKKKDLWSAVKKGHAGTDAMALLKEGAGAATDPLKESAFRAFVDLIRESGLVSEAAVNSGVNLATEIAGCLPLIGAVTNLGSGVTNSIHAIAKQYTIKKVDKLSGIITPGNPRSSMMAVRNLLERKRNDYAFNATLDVSAGGLQVAGFFADCGGLTGPGVGLAKAGVKLVHSIARTAQSFIEFRMGNELLRDPATFTASDIEKCPILGCYLITEAETSTLLAFLAEGSLGANWMDLVEGSKSDLDTLVRIANSCQLVAPYELKNPQFSNKGSVLKGAHMLDFRIHKVPQRVQHEARLIMKRDPRNLRFLGKQLLAKFGIA